MAVTVTPQQGPITNSKLVEDSDAGESAVNNTTGGGGTLYMVEIINGDAGGAVYFKIADATTATAGTTAASIVLMCAASATRSYVFPGGLLFSNGFSHWCTSGADQTSEAAPGATVVVRYVTT